uniref:Uncharacterized protein n=1 Tax=Anopheles albimanus TaxID=7167 RepID=A0A182F2R1_ANOAL
MEFQNVTDGNYFEMLVGLQQEHAKWHSESQAAIAENHALLNQSLKQVGDLVQQLSKMQSDLSKLREETTSMRATDTNRMQRLERNSDLIQRKSFIISSAFTLVRLGRHSSRRYQLLTSHRDEQSQGSPNFSFAPVWLDSILCVWFLCRDHQQTRHNRVTAERHDCRFVK